MQPVGPDRLVLAADVGGTNLTLALMARRQGRFEQIRRWRGSTQAEQSLAGPVNRFLEDCRSAGLRDKPSIMSVSAAGPLAGRRIRLTNAPWDIEAEPLERDLGLPVTLMNDFMAVSYGVLLLDPADPTQLEALPHPDGALPTPDPRGPVLILGAGTGLGMGYVTRPEGQPRAFPSEGGHMALPVLDEETFALWQYLMRDLPGPPDAERAVSGPGIAAIHAFLIETGRRPLTALAQSILALPEPARPAAISAHAAADAACGHAMTLFVTLYARVCSELTAAILPTGGLFLAGGIAAKNTRWFLEGQRFMRAYQACCQPHILAILQATPVYMAMDYDLSLSGAAHAGCLFLDAAGTP